MRTPDSCSIAPLCTARCWTPHSRILPSLLPCESPPLRSINGNEKASSADSAVELQDFELILGIAQQGIATIREFTEGPDFAPEASLNLTVEDLTN